MRRVIVGCLVVLGAALAAGPAQAVWFGHSGRTSGYYYPTTTYYYYPQAVPYYCPPVVAQPGGDLMPVPIYGKQYAQPQAAPPSQSKEPPLDKKMPAAPQVIESRSFSAADEKGAGPASGKGACKVGFWNATGRDVKLVVNGTAHTLARNRSLTLTLDREFAWHLEGQPAQQELVPDNRTAYEVVVR